jgi:hypothetical protein
MSDYLSSFDAAGARQSMRESARRWRTPPYRLKRGEQPSDDHRSAGRMDDSPGVARSGSSWRIGFKIVDAVVPEREETTDFKS